MIWSAPSFRPMRFVTRPTSAGPIEWKLARTARRTISPTMPAAMAITIPVTASLSGNEDVLIAQHSEAQVKTPRGRPAGYLYVDPTARIEHGLEGRTIAATGDRAH